MKVKTFPIILSLTLSMATASATSYVFTGTAENADLKDASSYVSVGNSSLNGIWNTPYLYPSTYTGTLPEVGSGISRLSYNTTEASLTANDTILISNYKLASVTDNEIVSATEYKPTTPIISSSLEIGTFYQRSVSSLILGTANSKDDLTLNVVKNFSFGYAGTATITKAEGATGNFDISVGGIFKAEVCDLTIGEYGNKFNNIALNCVAKDYNSDIINITDAKTSLNIVYSQGKGSLTVYTDKMTIAGDIIFKYDNSRFNLVFDQENLTSEGALLTVDGRFIRYGNASKIKTDQYMNLDFSGVDLSAIADGTVFDLIEVGDLSGFTTDDITKDFIITGLEAAYGENLDMSADIAWNGNVLQMTINNPLVPEPSTVALIFGAVAVAFVAIRRRK